MESLFVLAASVAVGPAVEAPSPLTVLALGISIVFIGLISIIILTKVMGCIMQTFTGKEKRQAAPTPAETVQQAEIVNRAEFVAAVTAAIAEDLGQDVSKIRIHSIRRI